ncbi:MAG: insulinase family protein [Cyclobacteriaceae bacterium]
MLDRTLAPAFHQDFSFDLPKPEVIKLTNGLTLDFLPGLQQNVFKLEIIFRAGKWYEPKLGVAHFTALMLDKGTKEKSSKKIAQLFDFYGAQIEISAGYDFTSVAVLGLVKYFKETFMIFHEILSESIFPEDELDLQKEIFIQNLRINNEKNSVVASKLIRKNIFGSSHPYGSSIEEADVSQISPENLLNYWASFFSPHKIFLIGNFNPAEIKWISENSNLPLNNSPIDKIVSSKPEDHFQRMQKAESVQCSIRLGMKTIK